jgi:hypothetical protein
MVSKTSLGCFLKLLLTALLLPPLVLAGDVKLAWDPSPASSLAGYRVYYGTLSGAYNAPLDVGNATTCTVSGLPASAFYFAVTAYDIDGQESDFSNEISLSISPSTADITTGLVAAYGFDEGTGSISADLSGSGDIASISSAGWISGKYGNALDFNGKSSYVFSEASRLPYANKPKTVAFWVYLTKKSSMSQSILTIADPALQSILKFTYRNSLAGTMNFGDKWLAFSSLPTLNAWHHVCYVFDGIENRLYIDGTLAGSSTIAPTVAATTSLQIGHGPDESGYFQGRIDEIRIYNRTLNADEIVAAKNTPLTPGFETVHVQPGPWDTTLIMKTADTAASDPVVDLSLDRIFYRKGDTVNASSFWIGNPAQQSRNVELKTWAQCTERSTISIGGWSTDGMFNLPAESNQDYGAKALLTITTNTPSDNCFVNARLIDPTTGDIFSEDINSFSILSTKIILPRNPMKTSPENGNLTWDLSEKTSPVRYILANKDSLATAVELKVWIGKQGFKPLPIITAGEDESLVLPAGSTLTVYPQAGNNILKIRALNPATGKILAEK